MKTKPWALFIDGEPCGQLFTINVQRNTTVWSIIPLSGCSFRLLCILAKHRGWVHATGLADKGHNVARYLYRMKKEIHSKAGFLDWDIIENDGCGNYRLDAPATVTFDVKKLATHPDYRVASLFKGEEEYAHQS